MNKYIKEDIDFICDDTVIPWSKFEGSTIVITGVTGLLGSLLLLALVNNNNRLRRKSKIFGVTRSPLKAKKKFNFLVAPEISFISYDNLKQLVNCDYLIHTASPTSSSLFAFSPVEVIRDIVSMSLQILDFSRTTGLKSLLFLSSMEIYGKTQKEIVTENDQGAVSSMLARSSYPESKRLTETLCASYFCEYDLPVKVVRLTQCFGAGVDFQQDERVFSEFAKCVISKSDIVLLTKGQTKRSYVYTSDAIRALLLVLLNGKNGEAYNVANPDTYCSISDMAKLVAHMGGVDVKQDLSVDTSKYCSTHCINLDISKIKELGWIPRVNLIESYQRMIGDLLSYTLNSK